MKQLQNLCALLLASCVIFSGCYFPVSDTNTNPVTITGHEIATTAPLLTDMAIQATENDLTGIMPESDFRITCSEEMTEALLKRHLKIEPDFSYSLTKEKAGSFLLAPTMPFAEKALVRFSLLDNNQIELTRWVFQTHLPFELLSSNIANTNTPYYDTSWKSISTGIEFEFSRRNIAIDSFFEIEPQVEGRFAILENRTVFIPNNPLEYDTTYYVTLTPGIADDEGHTLTEDFSYFFRTESRPQKNIFSSISITNTMGEVFLPTDPFVISFWQDNSVGITEGSIGVEIYALTDKEYLAQQTAIEKYSDAVWEEDYRGKPPTTGTIIFEEPLYQYESRRNSSEDSILLFQDSFPEGYYQVVLTDTSNPPNKSDLFWNPELSESTKIYDTSLFQVNSIANYTAVKNGNYLTWAMDSQTGQPLENASITFTGNKTNQLLARSKTDSDGVSLFYNLNKSQEILSPISNFDNWYGTAYHEPSKDDNSDTNGVLAISALGKTTLLQTVVLSEEAPTEEEYKQFIMTDRVIYHPTDTVYFGGILRKRDNPIPPDAQFRIELYREARHYNDNSEPIKPIYEEIITLDKGGAFSTTIPLEDMKETSYSIEIRELFGYGEIIREQYFYVENYYTPEITCEAKLTKPFYLPRETMGITLNAVFWNQTPVVGLVYNTLQIPETTTIATDETGSFLLEIPTTGDDTLRNEGSCYPIVPTYYLTGNYNNPYGLLEDFQMNPTYFPSEVIADSYYSQEEEQLFITTHQLDTTEYADPLSKVPFPENICGDTIDVDLDITITSMAYLPYRKHSYSYYNWASKQTVDYSWDEYRWKEEPYQTFTAKTVNGMLSISDLPLLAEDDSKIYGFSITFTGTDSNGYEFTESNTFYV